uniref:Uncharacterized protein n=1 Tax=Arundo donax TaxID=35708 RepID=A0A0A9D115_ARUDO
MKVERQRRERKYEELMIEEVKRRGSVAAL